MSIYNTKKVVQKESQTTEFKKSLAEQNEVLETISAFANTNGGIIYIGIEEDKEGSVKKITGVEAKGRTIENLANEIKQNTDPPIFPSITTQKIENKNVLLIEIQENPIKPVFSKGHVYKRTGRSNHKLSTLQIRDLTRDSIDYNFTELISEECKIEDIDENLINAFVAKAKEERNFNIDYNTKTDFLKKMHLLNSKGIINAAALLFGKNPQQFILQAQSRCGRFKGTKTFEFEDMQVINGTLVQQVDNTMNFIKRNLKVEATFNEGIERKETWEYPLLALKEGVVNAICHRDYTLNSNVQIRIYDDRLEIWSPGGLPKKIKVEQLRTRHESIPRNKLIANAFFMIKLVEQWGTGTNKMIDLCIKQGLPEPEFQDTGTSFVITFRKDILTETYLRETLNLNERQIKTINYLKEKKQIKRKDYEQINKVSKRTAIRDLNILVAKEILKTTGATDNKTYTLHSCQTRAKLVPK